MSRFITQEGEVEIIRQKEVINKHGTHDQSRHNPHKGGRSSLAGGTRYEPEEIKDIYADAEFELSDEELGAVRKYVDEGNKINGVIRAGKSDEYLTDDLSVDGKYAVSDIAAGLDSAIAKAPPMEDMAVWRVANVLSVEGLKVGDRVKDRGYASTTVADLTKPENGMMLLHLNSVSSGRKTLLEINTGVNGKGMFVPVIPTVVIGQTAEFEKEFLLPRNSLMEYLGSRQMPLKTGASMQIHQFKVVE